MRPNTVVLWLASVARAILFSVFWRMKAIITFSSGKLHDMADVATYFTNYLASVAWVIKWGASKLKMKLYQTLKVHFSSSRLDIKKNS